MASTKRGSGYNVPLHIIPETGKGGEDAPKSIPVFEGEDGAWIFQDAVAGLKLANDPEGVRPQPSLVSSSVSSADKACRLARHSARNDIWKAMRVGELVGADAVAISEVGVASEAKGSSISFIIISQVAVGDAPAEPGHVL